MKHKIYNITTWIWHKLLHVPIKLKKVNDSGNKKAKVTVVFLHGISATSDTWRTTINQFTKDRELADVRFVALDLLGFGQSLKADWLQYDQAEYTSALDRSLRSLKAKGVIILVGHSMGSLIAADYAVNYDSPISTLRELILVSPPVLMADELAKLPDKVYTKSYSALHKFAVDVPAAEVIAKLIQRFSSFRDYLKTAAFEKSMNNIILDSKNYQTFVKLHLPTLIIHGHFDPLVIGSNLKRAAKRNPRYIKYLSVIGHHDISVGKRAKILIEIKKVLKEESKNEAI